VHRCLRVAHQQTCAAHVVQLVPQRLRQIKGFAWLVGVEEVALIAHGTTVHQCKADLISNGGPFRRHRHIKLCLGC